VTLNRPCCCDSCCCTMCCLTTVVQRMMSCWRAQQCLRCTYSTVDFGNYRDGKFASSGRVPLNSSANNFERGELQLLMSTAHPCAVHGFYDCPVSFTPHCCVG
jgi:hypothetical protein